MNCKPGDLAIVVKSDACNEGKIVRCIRLNAVRSGHVNFGANGAIYPPEPTWDIDVALPAFDGSMDTYCQDSRLRPLRDPGDDAKDEMLRPLPEEVAA